MSEIDKDFKEGNLKESEVPDMPSNIRQIWDIFDKKESPANEDDYNGYTFEEPKRRLEKPKISKREIIAEGIRGLMRFMLRNH